MNIRGKKGGRKSTDYPHGEDLPEIPFHRRRWFLIMLLCIPLAIAGLLALPLLFDEDIQSAGEILDGGEEFLGKRVVLEGYVIIEARLSGTDLGLLQLFAPEHIDVIFPPQAKCSFVSGDLARVWGKVMSAQQLFDYVEEHWDLSPQEVLLDFLPSEEERRVQELIHIILPDEYLEGVTPVVIWADTVVGVKQ